MLFLRSMGNDIKPMSLLKVDRLARIKYRSSVSNLCTAMQCCLLALFSLFALLFERSKGYTNMANVDCGNVKARSGKIVNGEDAVDGEFPWMVSMVGLRGENFCGGVLISKEWVLTAAHCIMREISQFRISLTGPAMVKANELSQDVTKDNVLRKAARIVVHESYNPASSKIANDIALIMLEREVEWSDYIQPICLPNPDDETYSGFAATVAGWGFTNEINNGGKRPNQLQKLQVPVIENELCQKWYVQEKKSLIIGENSMCAGLEAGGKDACQGDSGGPLVAKKDGKNLAVGVVSAGIGCARPRLPGIYTRTSKYLEWIKKVLSE